MFWGKAALPDFDALIERIPKATLDSPRRSIVPLVDFWRMPDLRLVELGRAIGIDLGSATDIVFEHAVSTRGGRGKASYTDVLITTPSAAVAVEAKFTEPPYPSVRTWLQHPPDPNRAAVLDGWLGLIRPMATRTLTRDTVMDLPYQLVHRTASACASNRGRQAVVYLVFAESPEPHYARHLLNFDDALGAQSFLSFHLLGCSLTPSAAFVTLAQQWDRGERRLGNSVRAALKAGPLFSFAAPRRLYPPSADDSA
jgi:hypothetical protein